MRIKYCSFNKWNYEIFHNLINFKPSRAYPVDRETSCDFDWIDLYNAGMERLRIPTMSCMLLGIEGMPHKWMWEFHQMHWEQDIEQMWSHHGIGFQWHNIWEEWHGDGTRFYGRKKWQADFHAEHEDISNGVVG
jgi:hypothetical protein